MRGPNIGKRPKEANTRDDFNVIRRRAGVPVCSVHDLRRNYCTNLARTIPMHAMQELFGHSDIRTTRRYYVKVVPELLDAARRAVEASLEGDALSVESCCAQVIAGARMKLPTAIQEFYPDDVAHCYGCGRLNPHGLHIRSTWDGDETVAFLTPGEYHTAIPGYVYGGLIASLIDCHGTGSAALAAYRACRREPGSSPPLRFVTASLKVDYLRPTPMGIPLEARGRIKEVKLRKVVVDIEVLAGGQVCARGNVVTVLMPEHMASGGSMQPSPLPGQQEPKPSSLQ